MEDVRAWFGQPGIGTVETAAAPWWRLVQQTRPDIRTVTIRRPLVEVMDSLGRLGLSFDMDKIGIYLRRLDAKLDQIEARIPGVLSVSYASLTREESCAAVFEHCIGAARNPEWWRMMAALNLQTNLSVTLRYYQAYAPQLEKLAKVAKQRILAGMPLDMAPPEGVTIQQEPFETFFRDGQALFAEHLIQVGEAPDAFLRKNLPLMRQMDAAGLMQIITARSNGRMFGYLMTTLGPSLEEAGRLSAIQGIFFASSDYPGLGMKLQRASVAALRSANVDEVFFRAGVRGAGPKTGALYRRLGAEEYGMTYRLGLTAH